MLKEKFAKLITQREIIVRRDGEVKYLSLGKKSLALTYSFCILAAGASIYSGYSYFSLVNKLEVSSQKIEHLEITKSKLAKNLYRSNAKLVATRTELDQQYDRIEKIVGERINLHETLKSVHANLKQTTSDRNNSAEYATTLESKIGILTNNLASLNAYNEGLSVRISRLNRELNNIARDRDAVLGDREKLTREKSNLLMELASYRQDKEAIYGDLQETKVALATTREQFELSKFNGVKLQNKIEGLNSTLASVKTEREDLVSRVHAQAITSIDALRETIALTGLDPDLLLNREKKPIGKGGPFVDFSMFELEKASPSDGGSIEKMETSLSQWSELQSLMHHIPVSRPTDIGFISSSFGKRRDPITKKRAKHSGVDIAAYKNTPIYSTAQGEVIFAGRNGPYGKLVVVDHGHGFKTKYGHMKKILVKKGMKIDFRTKLGLMGTTGRSTGYHVHYEVLYNDKHLNPVPFFKAGKYAYKIKPGDTNEKSG
jgi:murein DD-endopeptidase MepM/ murein hydrolase activator NlpD